MIFSKIKQFLTIIKDVAEDVVSSVLSREHNVAKARIYIILLFVVCGYTVIALRLFSVTVIDQFDFSRERHSEARHQISGNAVRRADIVDRNGELLAINLTTTSIYANPKFITNPVDTAQKLYKIFPKLNYKDVLHKLRSNKSFVWIKRSVTPKEEQKVHDLGIPGLYFETSTKRAYPHGELFSHVLGYVGLDSKGLSGVERYFDDQLISKNTPLKLSLDTKVQNIIKQELLTAIKKFNAVGGTGILQDVTNGEILAIVSLPDYDPHNLNKVSEDALFNKATLGNYEVGSLFKVFTVAMALDNNNIQVNDVYDVNTPLHLAGYTINDYRGKGGWLSVPEILMYSSNIGTSQIALEMGKEKQFQYLKNLGFLSSLEVELYEKSTPSYSSLSKWGDLTTATVSYGHGISVSPLHIVKAMGAVVNGGKLYQPTIVKTENEIENYKQVLKESTSKNMRKLLRMIVKFGSGAKSEVQGAFVGGKSGTANKSIGGVYKKDLRISSFISTFPIYDPKYVMLISIDEPKGNKDSFGFATGGWVAAPATARVIEKLMPVLNILPELEGKEAIEKSLFINYNPRSELS